MRVLITGSSGFIGTNLMKFFIEKGVAVLGLDVKEPQDSRHSSRFVRVSLLDPDSLRKSILNFDPTHIVHLGARTDLDGESLLDYRENTEGLTNLIAICDELPSLDRVLFASSRLVCKIGYSPRDYGDYCPSTPYGESKVVGENIVKNCSGKMWSWCIFRPTSIWGEWFGVPYKNFFDLVRGGRYFHPKGLKVFKSFGYVGNVVHQISRLCDVDKESIHGRVFYSGDYESIEVFGFSKLIALEFRSGPPLQVPYGFLKVLAVFGDFLSYFNIRFPLTTFRLSNLITPMIHDFSDLEAVVGPLPYSVADGVARTVKWMKEN